MKGRTSLPILLSTHLLSGLLGCGGHAETGSGGSGTGGAGTGGTTTTGTGGSVPECTTPVRQVTGCLISGSLEDNPPLPYDLTTSGVVTAVHASLAGETCDVGAPYQIAWGKEPEVMIDLVQADGTPLTIGLAAPGFSVASVTVGETLAVTYHFEYVEWGGTLALLDVRRNGELIAAVGENMAAGLSLSEGAVECYREDDLCGIEDRLMDVQAPDGSTVSLGRGESAQVGELLVSNERFFHNYDISGACNFGLSTEYLMSAARAQ